MAGNKELTPRESELLVFIGQGKTSKQVAQTVHLSVFTVNNHRKHICRKLGLHSTAELVAYAARNSGAQTES
ncbi:MAG: LuxR C-terminal-related transcriptional regulator [Bryobacteraceae bacterium]